jgi:hypothetical protein
MSLLLCTALLCLNPSLYWHINGCVYNNNRWHLPIGGRIVNRTQIAGALFTVNPIAVNKNINVFTSNKREVTEVDSPIWGKVIVVAGIHTLCHSGTYCTLTHISDFDMI